MKTDILIVGCGVAGLYCALNLPGDKHITIITKSKAEKSDSFLAQGGICVWHNDNDYDAFFEDTLRAGHYENDKTSVDIMIRSSRKVISDLISYGVDFAKNGDDFDYTREGAHSFPRILYHQDETGKEITSKLLAAVRKLKNVTLIEEYTMVDIISIENECKGIIGHDKNGDFSKIFANYVVFATGGIGGVFEHSTNYRHLTADALAISLKHNIKLRHIDYIQIHPTTLYSEKQERAFLISESVRGEGAILLNSKGERFVDELLPRDIVTSAIYAEMEKEGSKHVWLSFEPISKEEIATHFPNIYQKCLEEGYDITKENIPVVPSQHYFMGGIDIDYNGMTSMKRLYAAGETACNDVHGKNRLASNSLLESLVFARRVAENIVDAYTDVCEFPDFDININDYDNYQKKYKESVLAAIKKEKNKK